MAERNVGYGFPRRIFKEKTILVDITKRSTKGRFQIEKKKNCVTLLQPTNDQDQ